MVVWQKRGGSMNVDDGLTHGVYRGEVLTLCGIDTSDWYEIEDDELDEIDCPVCLLKWCNPDLIAKELELIPA